MTFGPYVADYHSATSGTLKQSWAVEISDVDMK